MCHTIVKQWYWALFFFCSCVFIWSNISGSKWSLFLNALLLLFFSSSDSHVCACLSAFPSPSPRWTCTRMCVITCSLPLLHMVGPCTWWGSLPVGCAASSAPARKHSNIHPHSFDLFGFCVSWASPVRIKFHMRQHLPSGNPLRQYHSS